MTELNNGQENSQSFQQSSRDQIRGSSLLLFGRLISIGINMGSQILLVRYLTKDDFGTFAYALSIVAFFLPISNLGLKRAVSRFVPIYHEKGQIRELFGTITLAFTAVTAASAVIILLFLFFPEVISELSSKQTPALGLVAVLIFMVPLEGFDQVLIHLFASFGKPGAIFFRKNILGPGIKTLVILLLVVFKYDVLFLAYGYVFGSLLGILLNVWVLVDTLKMEGLLAKFWREGIKLPFKELFSFTVPALTSDIQLVAANSLAVLILGYYHEPDQVANFRAVMPVAKMNTLVLENLSMLFAPMVARYFARNDLKAISEFYWVTAAWTAVFAFPIFAVTFSLADPLTVFLFGSKYAGAGKILAAISFGYFFSSSLGHNSTTLKALAKMRFVAFVNLFCTIFGVGMNFLLIPKWGAFGAALSLMATVVVHNCLNQFGLFWVGGVKAVDRRFLSTYAIICVTATAMMIVQYIFSPHSFLALALAAVSSLVVLLSARKILDIGNAFPELLKVPVLSKLLKSNTRIS